MSTKGAALRQAATSSPSASPAPSTSKRKRGAADDAEYTSSSASTKRKRPAARTTQSEKVVKHMLEPSKASSPSVGSTLSVSLVIY